MATMLIPELGALIAIVKGLLDIAKSGRDLTGNKAKATGESVEKLKDRLAGLADQLESCVMLGKTIPIWLRTCFDIEADVTARSDEDVGRLRLSLIQRGKAMGMSLAEVKHILDLYGEHGQGKIAQLEYILGRIDESIRELEARRDHIATTLAELQVIRNEMVADMKRKRRNTAA